jgi:glycerol-3-phosphate dehydrogenase
MSSTPTTSSGGRAGAPGEFFDVVVIGAGIVGSAIARKLSGYRLSVALLEARDDVGEGTSKANTAILHTGFDAKPGTLESRMVREGYRLLGDYAKVTGIPVERTGAILVAWDEEQLAALPGLQDKANQNGYHHTEVIGADQVYAALPHIGAGALGGLTVPGESIICTWTTNFALATDAVQRGTTLLLNRWVSAVDVGAETTVLKTSGGDVTGRWVVNAAGLGGDNLDQLFGFDRFHITPRRGELLVFDKQARPLVDKIVLPVPTARGKGVLVSPTVYGNVMLGPTAEDLTDRTNTGTSEAGMTFLVDKGKQLCPQLLEEEVTATYAGLRAASDSPDYVIDVDPAKRYVLAGGIRSTGLTAGMAVAEYIDGLVRDTGLLELVDRDDLPAPPTMPNIGEAFLRPYQDAARIAADPAYGKIVCFCERVTAGEIRDTFCSPLPPHSVEGLRRRTRAQNGRCQGFFCGAEVSELLTSRGAAAGTAGPVPATATAAQEVQA